ncbi:MAG: hypothetical protein WA810_02740 [Maribacter sp.]
MNAKEHFMDANMMANLLITITLILGVIGYLNYSNEIDDEVKTVIVSALSDVNNSLVEQGTTK